MFRPRALIRLALLLLGLALVVVPVFEAAPLAAKRRAAPAVPPELRIVSVSLSPASYTAGDGTLDFTIEIELPRDLGPEVLLEVSSLISSPSKRSMRFLSSRQPIEPDTEGVSTAPRGQDEAKPRVEVTLTWDGLDQARQPAASGAYTYEIRAKLLAMSEAGPRTHMVSWPKRGTVVIK
ncbi:hypothetical protein [Candidatus Nitrospira bockiana]